MAITISLTFDDDWAGRIYPAINKRIHDAARHPVILALLAAQGFDDVDDLTPRQKAKLSILFDLLLHTMRYEGDAAEIAARETVTDDIETNFPLEIGDA